MRRPVRLDGDQPTPADLLDRSAGDDERFVGYRMTADSVAALLGVSRSTVSSYTARGQMPAPTECPCCGYGPTWDRAEIEAWQAARPGRTGRPPKEKP